jgi:hypothetical protein
MRHTPAVIFQLGCLRLLPALEVIADRGDKARLVAGTTVERGLVEPEVEVAVELAPPMATILSGMSPPSTAAVQAAAE